MLAFIDLCVRRCRRVFGARSSCVHGACLLANLTDGRVRGIVIVWKVQRIIPLAETSTISHRRKSVICKECYSERNRATPLLNAAECLKNHTQYICGSCGRCICIEHTERGLQRWNFPFRTLEIAKLYLRTADYTVKNCCGVYEIKNTKSKISYKILSGKDDLLLYLKKNPDKSCKEEKPVFSVKEYSEFPNTEVRKLTALEAEKYLSER